MRDWFKARAEALGCRVTVDDMGAMFARREGTADVPPIAMGSHLDTQPTGGKFDGVLGVLAALEALRTLVEAGYETHAPIEVVNWTNEEGSRFAPAMMASGVFAKVFERDWAHARQDPRGRELRRGARRRSAIAARSAAAIIRSRRFSSCTSSRDRSWRPKRKDIGVVTGVQAMRWYEATLTGQDAHTGATPMQGRKNALLGAARVIERVDAIGRMHAPGAVATVGRIENRPNSPNVVPGEVFFMVDMRHPDDAQLDQMEAALETSLHEICEPLGLAVAFQKIWHQPAVRFDAGCVAAVRRGAELSGFSSRDMISGAGHDAAYVSRVAPAAMVFVPCLGGISHNEAEFSSKEQCAAGAQVLLQAVLDYDRLSARTKRERARSAHECGGPATGASARLG